MKNLNDYGYRKIFAHIGCNVTLPAEAFAHTADYDAAITKYLSDV